MSTPNELLLYIRFGIDKKNTHEKNEEMIYLTSLMECAESCFYKKLFSEAYEKYEIITKLNFDTLKKEVIYPYVALAYLNMAKTSLQLDLPSSYRKTLWKQNLCLAKNYGNVEATILYDAEFSDKFSQSDKTETKQNLSQKNLKLRIP